MSKSCTAVPDSFASPPSSSDSLLSILVVHQPRFQQVLPACNRSHLCLRVFAPSWDIALDSCHHHFGARACFDFAEQHPSDHQLGAVTLQQLSLVLPRKPRNPITIVMIMKRARVAPLPGAASMTATSAQRTRRVWSRWPPPICVQLSVNVNKNTKDQFHRRRHG